MRNCGSIKRGFKDLLFSLLHFLQCSTKPFHPRSLSSFPFFSSFTVSAFYFLLFLFFFFSSLLHCHYSQPGVFDGGGCTSAKREREEALSQTHRHTNWGHLVGKGAERRNEHKSKNRKRVLSSFFSFPLYFLLVFLPLFLVSFFLPF